MILATILKALKLFINVKEIKKITLEISLIYYSFSYVMMLAYYGSAAYEHNYLCYTRENDYPTKYTFLYKNND